MKANVGGLDRVARAIVGLAIIGVGIIYESWWGAVGAVPLFTAVVRWCPPYSLLGISTRAVEEDASPSQQA